jgi:hypothetical protein
VLEHVRSVARQQGLDPWEWAQRAADSGARAYRDKVFLLTDSESQRLWSLWVEITNGAGEGGVTWSALDAYARLTGVEIEPDECTLLVEMAGAYRAEVWRPA